MTERKKKKPRTTHRRMGEEDVEEKEQHKEAQVDAAGARGGELDSRPGGVEEHEHINQDPLPQAHHLPRPRMDKPLVDLGHLKHCQCLEKHYPLSNSIHVLRRERRRRVEIK